MCGKKRIATCAGMLLCGIAAGLEGFFLAGGGFM
jgi:hypothetical protein